MDRDFLSEAEMLFIQSETNTLVLDYYAIENYWYHPDNVESYFISKEQPFDKQTYKDSLYNQFITDWKNNEKFNTDKIVN